MEMENDDVKKTWMGLLCQLSLLSLLLCKTMIVKQYCANRGDLPYLNLFIKET